MSVVIESLVAELQPFARELIREAGAAGLLPEITSARRSHMDQVRLYRKKLLGTAHFPVAFPGTSAHEYGEAFDMVVTPLEYLPDVGARWREMGGGWFENDPVHFELPGAGASHKFKHPIAETADFILGFVPGLGTVELAAELVHLGYPQSEVADFLSSPVTYSFEHRPEQLTFFDFVDPFGILHHFGTP